MRGSGDYMDEMGPLAISDSDVERILRGRAPDGPGLTRLVSMIEELRTYGNRRLRPEVAARHVSMAVEAVREYLVTDMGTDQPVVTPVAAKSPARVPKWRLIPRLGTSLATFVLLIGMTGVAVASDAAIPGDPLHGFDLAFENIGIGAGGAEERISEARELAMAGMPVEALDHVSTALESEQSEASSALEEAADRLRGHGDVQNSANQKVAEMLEWMAQSDIKGKDFGHGVAEWAKGLDDGGPDVGTAGASNGNAGQGKGQGKGRTGKGR